MAPLTFSQLWQASARVVLSWSPSSSTTPWSSQSSTSACSSSSDFLSHHRTASSPSQDYTQQMIQRCLEVCLVREFLWQPALLELSALPNHSSSWKDLSSGLFVVLHQCLLSLVWFLLVVNVHDLIVLNTLSVLWCQTKLCFFLRQKLFPNNNWQLWFITKMANVLKMRKTICIFFPKGRDLLLSCWLLGLLHLLEQGS